jgi:hypothetical protein
MSENTVPMKNLHLRSNLTIQLEVAMDKEEIPFFPGIGGLSAHIRGALKAIIVRAYKSKKVLLWTEGYTPETGPLDLAEHGLTTEECALITREAFSFYGSTPSLETIFNELNKQPSTSVKPRYGRYNGPLFC